MEKSGFIYLVFPCLVSAAYTERLESFPLHILQYDKILWYEQFAQHTRSKHSLS